MPNCSALIRLHASSLRYAVTSGQFIGSHCTDGTPVPLATKSGEKHGLDLFTCIPTQGELSFTFVVIVHSSRGRTMKQLVAAVLDWASLVAALIRRLKGGKAA